MKKLFSLICAVLFCCSVAGTVNATYIGIGDGDSIKFDFGSSDMDFYEIAFNPINFQHGGAKGIIDFFFPEYFGRMEGFGKNSRFRGERTHKDVLREYKDNHDFHYGKGYKEIDIKPDVRIPKEFHCKPETVVPIGSSAVLLGSGVLGLLLVAARRLKYRD